MKAGTTPPTWWCHPDGTKSASPTPCSATSARRSAARSGGGQPGSTCARIRNIDGDDGDEDFASTGGKSHGRTSGTRPPPIRPLMLLASPSPMSRTVCSAGVSSGRKKTQRFRPQMLTLHEYEYITSWCNGVQEPRGPAYLFLRYSACGDRSWRFRENSGCTRAEAE